MVKLILHTGECKYPDDPTLPFKLEIVMRPPEFMIVAWVGIHGGVEEVVARAASHEELKAWMDEHGLARHPRLSRWRITGPDESPIEAHNWPSAPASVSP